MRRAATCVGGDKEDGDGGHEDSGGQMEDEEAGYIGSAC